MKSYIKNKAWVTEKPPGSQETWEPQRNKLLVALTQHQRRYTVYRYLRFTKQNCSKWTIISLSWWHRNADTTETYKQLHWLADLRAFKVQGFRTETPGKWNQIFCQECWTVCRVYKTNRVIWRDFTLHLHTDRHGYTHCSEKTQGIWWLEKSHPVDQRPNPGLTLLSSTQQILHIWRNPLPSGIEVCHGISSQCSHCGVCNTRSWGERIRTFTHQTKNGGAANDSNACIQRDSVHVSH